MSKKVFNLKLLSRTLRYAIPFKWTLLLTFLVTISISILAPYRTILIGRAIDDHIKVSDIEGLNNIMLLLLGILAAHTVLQFAQSYLTGWLGQAIIISIRKKIYRHIIAFKLKYFDTNPIGALVTRVTSDIQSIAEIFSQGIINILADILQLSIALAAMFYLNWRLSIWVIIPIPILIIATKYFKDYIQKGFVEVRKNISKINTFVQEHVTGMHIVQLFNRQDEEYRRFKEVNKAHRDGWLTTVWSNAIFFPVVEILSSTSLAFLIWSGASGVIEGTSTVGEITAFILFVHMLFRPIRQLADKFNTLQMGMVASERVFAILDTNSYISDEGNVPIEKLKGQIEFKNVYFAYKEGENVLKDISFSVAPGEKLAVVGSTGAGKSTIVNVLTRFYEYHKGTIKIDDELVENYKLEDLRRAVAVVLQDVFLFNDSIANNISLGDESISREKIVEAAKEIGAHDFISKLPDGYDYVVRERGVMLSTGQRQLLAFIRAYVYDPQVLVLDEATSSIDSESENLIQNAIQKLTEGRTTIVIAHRLSTIKSADTILVMEQGQIIESGSHKELIALNGKYSQLYNHQLMAQQ